MKGSAWDEVEFGDVWAKGVALGSSLYARVANW